VRDVLIDQTRALRKSWFLDELKAGRQCGTYWGVSTLIKDYNVPTVAKDSPFSAALKAIRTRLNRFTPREQAHLINWGYALTDAAVRAYVDPTLPAAAGQPDPTAPL
jgi:NTE family protein